MFAPSSKIDYSEKQLADMAHRYSRLKPIQSGDLCCNCLQDCDGDGFSSGPYLARRVNGHPFCSRGRCYDAQMREFVGRRDGCRCGKDKHTE